MEKASMLITIKIMTMWTLDQGQTQQGDWTLST
jgi:hypothetical protein